MKLNAVAVASTNIPNTIKFYELLGFKFSEHKDTDQHIETIPPEGEPKLMIDSKSLIKEMLGEDPVAGNSSIFAIEYESSEAVDETFIKMREAGYKTIKEPWDAFWNQRYCIVEDPDGYRLDLYSNL